MQHRLQLNICETAVLVPKLTRTSGLLRGKTFGVSCSALGKICVLAKFLLFLLDPGGKAVSFHVF